MMKLREHLRFVIIASASTALKRFTGGLGRQLRASGCCTVENRRRLKNAPSAGAPQKRSVICEPLLEAVDLSPDLRCQRGGDRGESGPGAGRATMPGYSICAAVRRQECRSSSNKPTPVSSRRENIPLPHGPSSSRRPARRVLTWPVRGCFSLPAVKKPAKTAVSKDNMMTNADIQYIIVSNR